MSEKMGKIIIDVNEGKIQGFKKKSIYSNVEYYSFLGVPYGQPTGGQARFKEPTKVKPWPGTLNATKEKDGCIQFSVFQKLEICGTEDCLYNNIYTRKIPSEGDPLKAVIVCIHPGGYYHGSPDPSHYGSPEFIIHHDIVYVCISYRLHIIGGLNLNLTQCSGNQNLKDIILSLQWIRDNVSKFGGDPNNVTLMGSSSGSAIVHWLLLSPLARDLYHKAILMGVYTFSPVIFTPNENISSAFKIGQALGYKGSSDSHKNLLLFYKKLPMYRVIDYRPEIFLRKQFLSIYPSSPFMPTYEAPEYSCNSVLPLPPRKLISSTNRVPMMFGFCEREAVMAFMESNKQILQESFYKVLRQNEMGWGRNLTDDDLKQIQQQVESFYTDGRPVEFCSTSIKCDILTDISLSDVYDKLINIASADLPSSVYVYKFQYDGNLCLMKKRINPLLEQPLKGAFHAADYAYWAYNYETAGKDLKNVTAKDREIIDVFTSAITTFAKTGNPNCEELKVHWKPTNQDNPSYLTIGDTFETKDELINGKRMEFWHNLKQKFNKD